MASCDNKGDNKVFTWEFHFTNPTTGGEDSTQFCASTFNEAEQLFKEWCYQDEKFVPGTVGFYTYEVVYNEDDAKEYGENYGTPEDFLGRV